jgi:alpha-methylacyl-CoA racemase
MTTPPLHGIRIVEMAGIGPGPFCGMMLADHGAEVIRIDRARARGFTVDAKDPLLRNRKSVTLDLKTPAGIAAVKRIVAGADGLIEGFRPGVMERLGLSPDVLIAGNPRLVYGRMTGWGQTGPMAHEPGHDINYIAISGALHAYGRRGEQPTPPINMVADFGGGGMMLAFGMLAALIHAQRTGQGQVVDAAMTDGSALLMAMIWGFRAMGRWSADRGENLLDTGAHFYDTYETADRRYVSVGAIEPQFYVALRAVMGLTEPEWDAQLDPANWPALKQELARRFGTKTRDEWVAAFAGHEACFAPVLDFDEALADAHNRFRQTFVTAGGVDQPAPAPRYSASDTVRPVMAGAREDAAWLRDLGFANDEIAALGH